MSPAHWEMGSPVGAFSSASFIPAKNCGDKHNSSKQNQQQETKHD